MNDSRRMMMLMGRMDKGFTVYCLTMIIIFIQKILVVFSDSFIHFTGIRFFPFVQSLH